MEHPWVEVAHLDSSLNVTIYRSTANWQDARRAQQNYIRMQDKDTKRCPILYDPDEVTESEYTKILRLIQPYFFNPFIVVSKLWFAAIRSLTEIAQITQISLRTPPWHVVCATFGVQICRLVYGACSMELCIQCSERV